jgi:hypothetical protein
METDHCHQEVGYDGNAATKAIPPGCLCSQHYDFRITPPGKQVQRRDSSGLAHFFGPDRIGFTAGSDNLHGIRRSYDSFSAVALREPLSERSLPSTAAQRTATVLCNIQERTHEGVCRQSRGDYRCGEWDRA